MLRPLTLLAFAAVSLCAVQPCFAGKYAKVQSSSRPYGLNIFDRVQESGSDARAADFNANALPYFLDLIDQTLSESAVFNEIEGFKLDASRLFLRTESDRPIRIYFVYEGAGYRNSLGFSMTPAGSETMGSPYLLFPDSSFSSPTSTRRTSTAPLVIGDFVEIGTGGPGMQLDFFLIANGAATPYNTWFNNKELNVDGLQHVVAFMLPNSPYVMIGFEDLYNGGDRDYNDCLFVIDIGETNAENLFDIESTLPQ